MCGISVGYNVSKEIVQAMNERQGSRGPDHSGIEQMGNVIFAHTRLAIIDKSESGNQPMSRDGAFLKYYIVYNGEVYNFNNQEYSTDTSFILTQFIIDNVDCINELNGMFAFCVYDEYEQKITLVRDRWGIKPLYFWHEGDQFAAASTPAALTLLKSDWKLSQKGLQEYLSLGGTMLHSMFEGIEAVPPGHYVTFNCKTHEIKTTRWYFPKFIPNAKEVIRERVTRAINRVKLTCDWPQIVLLSGGIDSTLVSSQYIGKSAIHLSSPEQEYAEQVAKKFEMKLIEVDPTLCTMEEGLMDYSFKSGEPTMGGFIPWITCREIAKQGYRVAITANGADELFWGYDRMKGDILDHIKHIMRMFNGFCAISELDYNADERLPISSSRQMFEIYTYLMFDLNKTLDFASMCHSVEVRVPYLDHELVEAALSISMEDHVSRGNKTILKEMLWDLGFSKEFTDRPKVGFSLHNSPPDIHELTALAMAWYRNSKLPQLPENSTGRQESYHQSTVVGLYVWNKIYNLV